MCPSAAGFHFLLFSFLCLFCLPPARSCLPSSGPDLSPESGDKSQITGSRKTSFPLSLSSLVQINHITTGSLLSRESGLFQSQLTSKTNIQESIWNHTSISFLSPLEEPPPVPYLPLSPPFSISMPSSRSIWAPVLS